MKSKSIGVKNFQWLLLLFSAIIYCSGAGSAATAGSNATIDTLVKLLSQWSSSGNNQSILTQAAQHIDYQAMGEESLGAQWGKLSEAQRTEFVQGFKTLVEKRYYPRWHNIFSKSKLTYGKESTANGVTRINTQMTLKDSVQEVDWDLKGTGANARVVNLTVGEKDLVVRAGRRFQKRLEKAGFPAFMTWIKKEAANTGSASADE